MAPPSRRIDATRLKSIALVRSALLAGAREHFEREGLVELRVPVVADLTGACENVSSVLALRDSPGVALTQTGQLALERVLEITDGVWCLTGSYRRETVDERHLSEFELLEEEVSSRHPAVARFAPSGDATGLFDNLIERVTETIKAMVREAVTRCPNEIERLGGETGPLIEMLDRSFPVVSYEDALEILAGTDGTRDVTWGDDLRREDELALLTALAPASAMTRPVIVTRFPEQIKFFNMKLNRQDKRVVYSADLLLPGVGEAVGAAVREDDPDVLVERFNRLMLPRLRQQLSSEGAGLEMFSAYLAAVGAGRIGPHAGYGVGLERVLQYVVAEQDIRYVSMPWMLRQPVAESPGPPAHGG